MVLSVGIRARATLKPRDLSIANRNSAHGTVPTAILLNLSLIPCPFAPKQTRTTPQLDLFCFDARIVFRRL